MANPRPARRVKKDRTSLLISVVIHAVLIGGVVYWAWKSGKLEQMRQAVLQYVRSDKKEEKQEAKPIPPRAAPAAKLPAINQGLAPASGSGTRRAVAADAPATEGGESFFQDTRAQAEGPSGEERGGKPAETKPTLGPSARVTKPAERAQPILRSGGSSSVKALLQERAQAAAAVESFGSEQISRSSVSDAGDIVARVSGATVVEGKYAVIRGLTDRYSAATLNGAELPSADPYRRSAALDMFPAKIIDRVAVTKTFTPDQPGSFTGGNINIVTRSFPERPFASLEIGTAYNTQTTGNKNFLTYRGGSDDWLGMDDGTRQLPEEFWDSELKIPTWLQRMGRTQNLNRPDHRETLKKAAEIDRLTKLAGPAEFRGTARAPGPSHSFVAAAGDTAYLLGRPVGVFVSLPYSRSYSHYETGVVTRVSYQGVDELSVEKEFEETKSTEEVNWAATAAVAYQIFPDHQVGMNYIYNQYSEDTVRYRAGVDEDNDLRNISQHRLQWIERNLESFQFRGNHVFPDIGWLRADWLATFTETSQDEPDTRFYYTDGGRWGVSGLDPKQPTRYWRELDEQNENYRLDLTLPFLVRAAEPGELKGGLFSSKAERHYRERTLQYDTPSNELPYAGDPNEWLTEELLGAERPRTNGTLVTYTWRNFLDPPTHQSFYTGESEIPAAYAMADVPVAPGVRLIGGARFERTDIRTVSFTTAPTENVEPGKTNTPTPLRQDDLLPSLGLMWSVTPRLNVRVNYGETVARPSFRELAGVRTYDPVLDEFVVGNPELVMSAIKNYDARIEWFPRPGEVFSVGVFYKDLKDVIEREFISGAGDIITFVNRPEATVQGIEIEARKSLDFLSYHLRHWSVGGNYSWIESEERVSDLDRANHTRPELLGETRPLADQSPYIVNLDLTYDNPAWGTTVSATYNIFGPRLIIASLTAPDIYEQPAEQLDVVVSQRIGRNFRVKFAARNLLDPVIERTYGKDRQAIYSSYTRGQTFSLSLSAEF